MLRMYAMMSEKPSGSVTDFGVRGWAPITMLRAIALSNGPLFPEIPERTGRGDFAFPFRARCVAGRAILFSKFLADRNILKGGCMLGRP
ncbi:MAG: hypothetical protein H7X92_14350 [Chitinophagales bacterium]|nr:hypothetical protein [Hyphomicrobiales bacterium]